MGDHPDSMYRNNVQLRPVTSTVNRALIGGAVRQPKAEPGKGRFVGGVTLPPALAELGSIDEHERDDGDR